MRVTVLATTRYVGKALPQKHAEEQKGKTLIKSPSRQGLSQGCGNESDSNFIQLLVENKHPTVSQTL